MEKFASPANFLATYMLVPGSWSGRWGLGDLSRLVRNDYSSNASLRLSLSTFALPPALFVDMATSGLCRPGETIERQIESQVEWDFN